MKIKVVQWIPALLLAAGVLGTIKVDAHRRMPLRASLSAAIPLDLAGYDGRDLPLAEQERQVAGVSAHLLRNYVTVTPGTGLRGFSVYVGYYDRQGRGKTIHSPRNCLPGNGWEPLTSSRVAINTTNGVFTVNRYVLQRGRQRALVLYWYQGRGRVQANEYLVKRDLLRDAALLGRSEEALVRITVPVIGAERDADRLAARVAGLLIPAAGHALPL